ncbi:MAG: hypothetical protein ACM3SV_06950 [Betaproteobacteria bacterium]
MKTAIRIACLLALPSPLALAAPSPAGGLGTLFYSPEERAAIVQARSGEKAAETAAGLAVNGLVKRASGKGTVWVNGQSVPEGQAVPPAAAPTIRHDGVVISGTRVRVGETLNPRTGERADFITPGAVSTAKPK